MVAISGLVQVMGTRSRLFRTIPSSLQDPQASFPEKTAPQPSTTAQARSSRLHTSTICININIHYLWPGLFYVPSIPLVDTLQICKSKPHHSFPTLTAMSSYSVGSPTKYSTLKLLPSKALLCSLLDKATPIASQPCSLFHDVIARKTINPHSYSAITGHCNLDSSVIHSSDEVSEPGDPELFAELLAAQGVIEGPVGSPLVIKYFIKQQILADCWERHKLLGPVLVKIHVLDPPGPSQETLRKGGRERRHSVPHQQTGHPNICGILEYFEGSDCYCLVMLRFGDNKDLFKHIELAPNGLLTAKGRRIFGHIFNGVAFLHERNIVHRDLRQECHPQPGWYCPTG
ncbi:hypothetical protein PtA15_17A181 [Puccinia triticina]|uniref:Protein kinase domain-containing protein n=1 Tax=Puccinia triticina TaxID=208348 RepID=A0ABY7D4Z0_9BASI|nr:uncharacterized protein PtA15_17A181 [Puccinia triticina]WAQ92699.1 hypothetical protein PtA15_17A181 [Puccinia triticina]